MTREEIIKILDRRTTIPDDNYSWEDINEAIDMAIEALNQQKEGHWIDCENLGDDGIEYWCECSECHSERAYKTNFCPDCGAKMKGSE